MTRAGEIDAALRHEIRAFGRPVALAREEEIAHHLTVRQVPQFVSSHLIGGHTFDFKVNRVERCYGYPRYDGRLDIHAVAAFFPAKKVMFANSNKVKGQPQSLSNDEINQWHGNT